MRILLVPSGGIAPRNRVEGTTTLPRLEKAAELLRSGAYDVLLLSGGQCHAPEVETQPAALTMAAWFAEQGADGVVTILEDESRDTYENISCSLARLQLQPGVHEITVVSHWQHTLRFMITFWLAYGLRIKCVPLHYPIPLTSLVAGWGLILYHLYDRYGTKYVARSYRAGRTKDKKGDIYKLRCDPRNA